jgi:hypothetical protein
MYKYLALAIALFLQGCSAQGPTFTNLSGQLGTKESGLYVYRTADGIRGLGGTNVYVNGRDT